MKELIVMSFKRRDKSIQLGLVGSLTKIKEYPLQASLPEIMEKIKGIVELLTQQREIIKNNRDQWYQYSIDLQKDMKIKLDIIRNLENEIDLQKNLVSCIAETDLTGIQMIVPEIFGLHDCAITTLESMKQMKKENNPKLIPEIQSISYQFKNGLLEFVEYLENMVQSKGETGLRTLDSIVEARNKLIRIAAYIIRDEN